MKLFSRDSGSSEAEDDFDTLPLPTREDLNEEFISPETAPPVKVKSKPRYSIEDAIELMRTLPDENDEIVVTVVNKTLESMNIAVTDIIQDAEEKEVRIRDQHKTLEQKVKELQAVIAKRENEMSDMMADLKETMEVKQRLKLALDIEKVRKKSSKPTTPPASAKAEEVATADSGGQAKSPETRKASDAKLDSPSTPASS